MLGLSDFLLVGGLRTLIILSNIGVEQGQPNQSQGKVFVRIGSIIKSKVVKQKASKEY